MVWRHRRMLELFTEKPNLYRTRQPKTDAAMIRQTTRPFAMRAGDALTQEIPKHNNDRKFIAHP